MAQNTKNVYSMGHAVAAMTTNYHHYKSILYTGWMEMHVLSQ